MPDEKMIMEAICRTRCEGNLEFTWNLWRYTDYNMLEPRDLNATLDHVPYTELAEMITNPLGELQLAFKPDVFPVRTKFTLQIVAQRPSGVFGEFRRIIKVNTSPTGGRSTHSQ